MHFRVSTRPRALAEKKTDEIHTEHARKTPPFVPFFRSEGEDERDEDQYVVFIFVSAAPIIIITR